MLNSEKLYLLQENKNLSNKVEKNAKYINKLTMENKILSVKIKTIEQCASQKNKEIYDNNKNRNKQKINS